MTDVLGGRRLLVPLPPPVQRRTAGVPRATARPHVRRRFTVPPAADFTSVSRRYVRWLVAGDLVGAGVANTAVLLAWRAEQEWLGVLATLVWPLIIGVCGGYRRRHVGVGTREIRAVLQAAPLLVLLGAYPAAVAGRVSLLTLVAFLGPLCVAWSLGVRFLARQRLHRLQSRGIGSRRTLLVGPRQAVASLAIALRAEPYCGMLPVAACLPEGVDPTAVDLEVVGNLQQIRSAVDAGRYDAVAVTGGECLQGDYLRRLAWSLEGSGTELLVAPGLAEVVPPRLDLRPVVGMPLLHVQQPSFTGWRFGIKRAMDLGLTSAGLIALAPLLGLVALAIKLQDGGPVLFKQVRIGRGGEPFEMLKFRSMVLDAEERKAALMALNEGHGGLFKLTHDPRVTKLGRFLRAWSIDELPQLFNVLGGSMSLVGPRPHLAHEIEAMPPDASRRALVIPGLTGLWQISGRSDLPGSEGMRLDLRYVENWSISLDLHIIWKTFRAVLTKAGAR